MVRFVHFARSHDLFLCVSNALSDDVDEHFTGKTVNFQPAADSAAFDVILKSLPKSLVCTRPLGRQPAEKIVRKRVYIGVLSGEHYRDTALIIEHPRSQVEEQIISVFGMCVLGSLREKRIILDY